MTPPPLILQPAAKRDIAEARSWYEARRKGLGKEFLAAVRETLEAVERTPLRFPRVRHELRRAPIHRFLYAIFYVPEEEQTVVLACFHARRSPKLWEARLITGRR
jgi:plasmid stabilization system protein ParE